MNKEELEKFYRGLLGFPVNVFDEDNPYYEHNCRTMKRLSELKEEGLL